MQKKEIFRLRFSNSQNTENVAAHSEIELIYLLEGSIHIQVEQKESEFNKDDILVINPDRRRSIIDADNPLIMHLMIDYTLVRDAFQGQDILFWCDSCASDNEKYQELRKLLKRMVWHYVQTDKYESSFLFISDCYEILDMLTTDFMVKAADIQWSEEGDRFEERLFKINNYINSNYDQPISIKELSEKLYLSIGYLSRFFKKNYGMNFANYLTNVRLLHATDELLYTNTPVTRIAYDCGFTSAAVFNKAFKKMYDVTPTDFRKQAAKEEDSGEDAAAKKALDSQIGQIALENEFSREAVRNEALEESLEAEFSAAHTIPFSNYWGETINISGARNLLNSLAQDHLKIISGHLHFRYVRFWSIFTEDFYIKPGQDHYDFSRIDAVLDFVLQQGWIPFIDLGLKPRILLYEIGRSDQKKVREEYTCEEWEKLMKAFMRHLSTRYGANELDNWRMELWFDEQHRDDRKAWDEYLKMFTITYRAVKSCNDSISLGGYGIRMDYGGDARIEFFKLWKRSAPLPDFISVMYYAYARGEDGKDLSARRVTDDAAFKKLLEEEKKRLQKAGMGDIPVNICEWNFTPSVRNIINDSCYKGAYVMRNILDVYQLAQSMGYGAGSDLLFSSYDTSDMLFGGAGLITRDGIMKPAGYAMGFLNRTFSNLIGIDTNYLITTDEHNNYVVVCHNQQKLNEQYYLTPETQIRRDADWKYFDDLHRLKLRIVLRDVKEGHYRIRIYRVNNHCGSVLDTWESMDFENELSRDDISYLQRTCVPKVTIQKTETVQGNLVIQAELDPNEIARISVRYIS